MMVPTEVIEYAIKTTKTPSEAAKLITKYNLIREQKAARKIQADQILAKAKKQAEELLNEEICKHELKKRHGDPSGGSDTQEECLICGEWFSDRGYRQS